MKNERAEKRFRSEVAEFLAVQMGVALERLVWLGLEHSKKKWLSRDQLRRILDGRGALIIRGILDSFDPSVAAHVRSLDERTLWRVYWDLRSNSVNMNIFAFIGALDDPYPAFA
ncbi:MAG: hypothetical protein PHD04_03120 [Candidatus Pacebacteria bacterium]|nr:hypothetical protein [Candidatus Paceibacterota bacterium]